MTLCLDPDLCSSQRCLFDFNGIFDGILRAACALSRLYCRIVVASAHIEWSGQAAESELVSEDASSELPQTGMK